MAEAVSGPWALRFTELEGHVFDTLHDFLLGRLSPLPDAYLKQGDAPTGVEDRGSGMSNYHAVNTSDEISELIASPRSESVLFLYDPYCPTNWRARTEMDDVGADIWIVDVAENPMLAKEIERRTQVKHESPQVLVLKDGKVLWHRSHGGIRASSLQLALKAAA